MKPGKVLVVEDDQQIRETLQQVLELEGYEAMTASHGRDALELLEKTGTEGRPQLILLDLMMPVMSGWEVIKVLQSHSSLSDIPVIIFSAAMDISTNCEHAKAFIRKPLNLDLLLELVEKHKAISE